MNVGYVKLLGIFLCKKILVMNYCLFFLNVCCIHFLKTRLCSCLGSFGCTRRLNSERNQLAEASCKTCGGKFLADGIELVSDSMLETVGPEVMNSNIPELNWKTVTKGRRSKKPVVRNLKVVAKVGNTSPKRVGNFSGSDSDKV